MNYNAIRQAQIVLREHFSLPDEAFDESGEINGDFLSVYRLGGMSPWCFKCELALGPVHTQALAVYLRTLQDFNPDHETTFASEAEQSRAA